MAIELIVDIQYSGEPGSMKRFTFSDLRDTFKEILAVAQEHRVDPDFIKQIVSKMPSIGKLAVERVRSKFDPYIKDSGNDASKAAVIILGEIASMDNELQVRIKRRAKDMLSSFGPLTNCKEVMTGKNPEGEWVVKLVYETKFKPEVSHNSYDEETGLRTTWCEKLSNEEEATRLGQWLAGVIDVRHSFEVLK